MFIVQLLEIFPFIHTLIGHLIFASKSYLQAPIFGLSLEIGTYFLPSNWIAYWFSVLTLEAEICQLTLSQKLQIIHFTGWHITAHTQVSLWACSYNPPTSWSWELLHFLLPFLLESRPATILRPISNQSKKSSNSLCFLEFPFIPLGILFCFPIESQVKALPGLIHLWEFWYLSNI